MFLPGTNDDQILSTRGYANYSHSFQMLALNGPKSKRLCFLVQTASWPGILTIQSLSSA